MDKQVTRGRGLESELLDKSSMINSVEPQKRIKPVAAGGTLEHARLVELKLLDRVTFSRLFVAIYFMCGSLWALKLFVLVYSNVFYNYIRSLEHY